MQPRCEISFGCSRILRYETIIAECLKRMIKHKRLQKVWVDTETEFKSSFKTLSEKKANPNLQNIQRKKIGFRRKKNSFFDNFDIQVFRRQVDFLH